MAASDQPMGDGAERLAGARTPEDQQQAVLVNRQTAHDFMGWATPPMALAFEPSVVRRPADRAAYEIPDQPVAPPRPRGPFDVSAIERLRSDMRRRLSAARDPAYVVPDQLGAGTPVAQATPCGPGPVAGLLLSPPAAYAQPDRNGDVIYGPPQWRGSVVGGHTGPWQPGPNDFRATPDGFPALGIPGQPITGVPGAATTGASDGVHYMGSRAMTGAEYIALMQGTFGPEPEPVPASEPSRPAAYTARRMREEGFMRGLLPPMAITNDDLDRQVDPVELVDQEQPLSAGGLGLPPARAMGVAMRRLTAYGRLNTAMQDVIRAGIDSSLLTSLERGIRAMTPQELQTVRLVVDAIDALLPAAETPAVTTNTTRRSVGV